MIGPMAALLPGNLVADSVRMALAEDLGLIGDITSRATIPAGRQARLAIAHRALFGRQLLKHVGDIDFGIERHTASATVRPDDLAAKRNRIRQSNFQLFADRDRHVGQRLRGACGGDQGFRQGGHSDLGRGLGVAKRRGASGQRPRGTVRAERAGFHEQEQARMSAPPSPTVNGPYGAALAMQAWHPLVGRYPGWRSNIRRLPSRLAGGQWQ